MGDWSISSILKLPELLHGAMVVKCVTPYYALRGVVPSLHLVAKSPVCGRLTVLTLPQRCGPTFFIIIYRFPLFLFNIRLLDLIYGLCILFLFSDAAKPNRDQWVISLFPTF